VVVVVSLLSLQLPCPSFPDARAQAFCQMLVTHVGVLKVGAAMAGASCPNQLSSKADTKGARDGGGGLRLIAGGQSTAKASTVFVFSPRGCLSFWNLGVLCNVYGSGPGSSFACFLGASRGSGCVAVCAFTGEGGGLEERLRVEEGAGVVARSCCCCCCWRICTEKGARWAAIGWENCVGDCTHIWGGCRGRGECARIRDVGTGSLLKTRDFCLWICAYVRGVGGAEACGEGDCVCDCPCVRELVGLAVSLHRCMRGEKVVPLCWC